LLISLKDKDDQLNEFLSSLGSDPSSPLLEDFNFTTGRLQILSSLSCYNSTILFCVVGFRGIIYSALLAPLSRLRWVCTAV